MCHPPYFAELAPNDYHFFRNLDNFLRGQKINSYVAVKTAFKELIDFRTLIFFRKGLNELPMELRKCILLRGGMSIPC